MSKILKIWWVFSLLSIIIYLLSIQSYMKTIEDISLCKSIDCSDDKINIIKKECEKSSVLIKEDPFYLILIDEKVVEINNECFIFLNKKNNETKNK